MCSISCPSQVTAHRLRQLDRRLWPDRRRMGRRSVADVSPARIGPGLPGGRGAHPRLGRRQRPEPTPAIILRFAGLYGPDRIVRRSILERGEPIPGDPRKFLNLIHIDDAARRPRAALAAGRAEPLYLVSDDRPVTRLEYYTRMATLLGTPAPRFETPAARAVPTRRADATNKRVCPTAGSRPVSALQAACAIRTSRRAGLLT